MIEGKRKGKEGNCRRVDRERVEGKKELKGLKD